MTLYAYTPPVDKAWAPRTNARIDFERLRNGTQWTDGDVALYWDECLYNKYICTIAFMYLDLNVCIQVCMYVCMFVGMYECVNGMYVLYNLYVCVYVCIHACSASDVFGLEADSELVYVHLVYTYTCMHAHVHTYVYM